MTTLSQRDMRWASVKLGFSTTSTIGNYGCLITCFSMIGDTTPDDFNARLKAVQGFSNDLVIWAKVKEVIPYSFTPIKAYDNTAVLAEIEKNQFCLVEVDFDGKISSPNDTHFVLYIGNKQCLDPWTGIQKNTSYYPLVKGYSSCTKLSTPAPTTIPAEITDQTKIPIGGDWGSPELQALRSMLSDQKKTLEGILGDQAGLKTQIGVLQTQIQDIANKLGCPNTQDAIMGEIAKLVKLEDQSNEVPETPGWAKEILDLFKKIMGR